MLYNDKRRKDFCSWEVKLHRISQAEAGAPAATTVCSAVRESCDNRADASRRRENRQTVTFFPCCDSPAV